MLVDTGDKGLPFHGFLSRVRPSSGVPANAVYLTLLVTCLIALIVRIACVESPKVTGY